MPRIDKMYAFVMEDTGPDDEGIIGAMAPNSGQWMPLVGGDMERMESLKPVAAAVARAAGKRLKLLVFDNRTEVSLEREGEQCPSPA